MIEISLSTLAEILTKLKPNQYFDICDYDPVREDGAWYGFHKQYVFDTEIILFDYYGGGASATIEIGYFHYSHGELVKEIQNILEAHDITEIWVEEKDLKRGHS